MLEAEDERDELQGVVEDLQAEKGKLSDEVNSKQVCYYFKKEHLKNSMCLQHQIKRKIYI